MTPKVVAWMNADLLWNGSREQVWVKFSGKFHENAFQNVYKIFVIFTRGQSVNTMWLWCMKSDH